MKYLSQYMEARQTVAFETAGAFFAFGQWQFDSKKQEGVKYISLMGGLICPEHTAQALLIELKNIYKESIKQDIEENGLNGIIRRELNNHEAYYTGDIESTIEALSDYPITKEDIYQVFKHKDFVPNHA